MLSEEELAAWQADFDRNGIAGLQQKSLRPDAVACWQQLTPLPAAFLGHFAQFLMTLQIGNQML